MQDAVVVITERLNKVGAVSQQGSAAVVETQQNMTRYEDNVNFSS
jgi:hypothetical protein